jgi:hypothetical protein
MSTKIPALKNIPTTIDRELRDTLDSMKEAQEVRLGRRGDPLDRAITLRELIDSGLAKQLRNRPFDPGGLIDFIPNDDTVGDLTIPPAPTGLEASGAFTEIIVNWNPAQYSNHAFTEVWRSRDDEVGTATLITTTASFIITDPVGYDQTYFYWVRFVSTSNIRGPFNQTNGTKANTIEDIGAVMIQLSETLQQLPGYSIITGLITTEAAVPARVIRSSNAPTVREDGSAIQPNDIWFDTDDGQIYTRNSANNAWVAGRDATLVTLFGSTSFTGSTLTAAMATAQGDIVTVTNAQNATASSLTSLTSTVNSNTSAIATEQTTRANADTALASDITSLTSTVTSNNNTLTASINSEATTRANADTALTNSINSLTSTVGGNSSSITALNTTTASHTGDLNAMFVLTASTESNGSKSVAGMVIGSNASNGSGAQSFVQFQADKFAIWNGTNANVAPFIVSGGTVFIDSARIQDGAITNARILDGTIQNAKIGDAQITTAKIGDLQVTTAKIALANITTALIGDAQITNAKINDLSADKINAGTISADRIGANTITATKINTTDLSLPSNGGEKTGTTLGYWHENDFNYRHVAEIGSGAGFYTGYVRVFKGSFAGQIKTISFLISDGTFGPSSSNNVNTSVTFSDTTKITESASHAILVTTDLQYLTGGWISQSRLTTSKDSGNIPLAFRYTGTGTLNFFIYAQADSNFQLMGGADARFVKFSS